MDKPPSRYEVTVRVAKDDGHPPDPATFAAGASQAASSRNASIISAHTSVRSCVSSDAEKFLGIVRTALTWVVLATAGASERFRPRPARAGLAAGMVRSRTGTAAVARRGRGARHPGLLALRSASGLGPPAACGQACPDSVQPGW